MAIKIKGNVKSIIKTFVLLLVISLVAVFILVGGNYLFPRIELKGERIVTLNYKEKYKEAGYKAKFLKKDITDQVKVSGKVNSEKLGTYEISYEVGDPFKRKATRVVKVKDKSKPVIELESKGDIYLCPGRNFSGMKATAYDNYDGDLTKKIQVKETDDSVSYTVKDSSGNKKIVKRRLIYEDKTIPQLTLKGNSVVYIFLNDTYTDAGVTASDNCDGDITSKVTVENGVNSNKVGKYEVKYSISDSSGNSASVSRTVIVSERGKNGTIYLTFDDGPQYGTTNVILDILKEESVKATFFVTGKGPDELIKREFDEGHAVALHTNSHDYATVYASADSYFNDLNAVNERVKRITGSYSTIIRFPGGSSNTISRRYSVGIMSYLTKEVLNRGYRYYDWNISSGDAAGVTPSPEQIKNNVVNSLRRDRPNMVLMHDVKANTRDAIRGIIRYGKENGYTFEKITPYTDMVRHGVNN